MAEPLPRPPFDPAYTMFSGFPNPSLTLDVPMMREGMRTMAPDVSIITAVHPQYTHTEISYPGLANPSGSPDPPVTLSLWQLPPSTPNLHPHPNGRPLIYYIHGGGQIAGSRFAGPQYAMSLFSPEENILFASPEYRLAPEDPAPAAARDVYAGLLFLVAHAKELGVDAERIVLYGSSGGAAVAAGAVLLGRSVGGPRLKALVLNIPMLDDRRAESVSTQQFWDGTVWPGWMDEAAWKAVLGGHDGELGDGTRVPGRALSLKDLPPVFIDIGDCESMRDQAVAFASRIWRDGGSAELHVWPGVYHGAALFEPDVPVSQDMHRAQRAFLRRVLGLSGDGVKAAHL